MTTAADFAAAGVRFIFTAAAVKVQGPAGRRDIAEQLRAEVARRVPLLASLALARATVGPVGIEWCETCGDPLACGRGGMCDLCCAARRKAFLATAKPVHAFRLEAT
jgi:hypothetical protein